MIKMLIADDHAIVREGLKQIVLEAGDIVVADEASTGHEVLDKVYKGDFDMVLLDISLPGMNGIDVLKQIKSEKPKVPVLILTMHPEEQFAMRALKAGASGYLTKESVADELLSAIRKVSRGGKYISATLAERLAYSLDTTSDQPLHEKLSDREYQVMCKIASGRTVKEISDELALSEKTISTYRTRILEKMNLRNNSEIIRYAIQHKIVD